MRISADDLLHHLHKDLRHIVSKDLKWSIDSSTLEVMCYRLQESLVKKFNQEEKPSSSACDRALAKFCTVNERCSKWSLQLNHMWEEELVNELRSELRSFWYVNSDQTEPLVSTYNQVFDLGRTGPGASRASLGTDMYSKLFGKPLSCTEGLSSVWSVCSSRNPQLTEAWSHPSCGTGVHIVDGNQLSFVNKTTDIARLIATEPTCNMWMQLGFGRNLERRLRSRFSIDLGTQPEVNRLLAMKGSLHNQLVTIDLESASDSMSLRMLESILPKSFIGWLLKLRSPSTRLPNGSIAALNMVSTMGNGFTFPLMTAVISCAVSAVYKYLGIPLVTHKKYLGKDRWYLRNFAVFGDDIIVDKRVSRHVVHLLTLLGFVVNDEKTYIEGPFRESCGVDAFLGTDVRPVYLRQLNTLQDAFVAINNLNYWTAKSGVPLRHLVQFIRSRFHQVDEFAVPPDEGLDAGLHLPECLSRTRRNTKWDKRGGCRYVCFTPKFYGLRVDGSIVTSAGLKKVPYNPRGLEVAFIAGSVRGYRISVRQTPVRYTTKRRYSPNWGYLPPQILPGLDNPGRSKRFANACKANFL